MMTNPQSWKSATFLVASAAPRDRAMAPICASKVLVGLPFRRRSAAIEANAWAAAASNAKTRPAKGLKDAVNG